MRRQSSRTLMQSKCMRCTSSSSSSSSSSKNARSIQSCTMNLHHRSFPAQSGKLPMSPPIKSPKHLRVSAPPSISPSFLAVEQNNTFMVSFCFTQQCSAGYCRDSIMPHPHYLSFSASNTSSNSPMPLQLTTFATGSQSAFPSCAKVISPSDDPACQGVFRCAVSVLAAM